MKSQLRAVTSKDRPLAELARDTQQALSLLTESKIVSFTREYAFQMVIAFDHEPAGVNLLRVRYDAEPETPIATIGSVVPFVYRNGAIEITLIEGLTEGYRYRFTFEVVG